MVRHSGTEGQDPSHLSLRTSFVHWSEAKPGSAHTGRWGSILEPLLFGGGGMSGKGMASRGRGSGFPSSAARLSQEPCIASSCWGPHSAARSPRLLLALPRRPMILHAPGAKPARAAQTRMSLKHTRRCHFSRLHRETPWQTSEV